MSNKTIRPIAAAIGASFLAMAVVPLASAAGNPFATHELNAGYELTNAAKAGGEGKCGEGKCGGSNAESEGSSDKGEKTEGKCGEGKCGGNS